ncbi:MULTISPECIES: carbohydrate ABC transporter permease [unclassified Paenibacillus]|uniref:carbohydrate ABC transporter permease n=1 Tax=unclassified Paenibacillus TaxID=185978 RepID=UPI002F405FAC
MKKKARGWTLARQEEMLGYMLILPFAVGFILFQLAPFATSIAISFTNLSFISNLKDIKFIGLDNFIQMFGDDKFTGSLWRTFYYVALFVPGIIIASLLCAMLINSRLWFRKTIRTAIFMPYVSNFVAIAVVWAIILDVRDGPVNAFLTSLGVSSPPLWLVGEHTVIPSIVLIVVWQNIGFFMLVFLAALQNVPSELYEAAKIDGAGRFKRFWSITTPMVSPTTFLLMITAIITSFQNFGPIQVLTKGGPGQASTTLSINIYQETFLQYRMGYSTAQAIFMFLIILGITVVQWRGQKKWVNYS